MPANSCLRTLAKAAQRTCSAMTSAGRSHAAAAWGIKCPLTDETDSGKVEEIARDCSCAKETTAGASVTRMAQALAPSPMRRARSAPAEGEPGWRPSRASNRLPAKWPGGLQRVGSVWCAQAEMSTRGTALPSELNAPSNQPGERGMRVNEATASMYSRDSSKPMMKRMSPAATSWRRSPGVFASDAAKGEAVAAAADNVGAASTACIRVNGSMGQSIHQPMALTMSSRAWGG